MQGLILWTFQVMNGQGIIYRLWCRIGHYGYIDICVNSYMIGMYFNRVVVQWKILSNYWVWNRWKEL